MNIQTQSGMARFFRGIDYIEHHLWDSFTVEDVAGAAAWSPYHYARLFRLVADDSVMAYARRRRLTEAAKRIVLGADRLIDIALDCQFSSQEAFSRAFSKQMGMPPGNLRNLRDGRQLPILQFQRPITLKMLNHIHNRTLSMTPQIISFSGTKIIGLTGRYGFHDVAGVTRIWQDFFAKLAEAGQTNIIPAYGAVYNADLENDEMDYMAAISSAAYDIIPEGFEELGLTEGLYAKFTHESSGKENFAEEVKQTSTYIYGAWLPASSYTLGKEPIYEYYDQRFDMKTMRGEIDIHVPIQEK